MHVHSVVSRSGQTPLPGCHATHKGSGGCIRKLNTKPSAWGQQEHMLHIQRRPFLCHLSSIALQRGLVAFYAIAQNCCRPGTKAAPLLSHLPAVSVSTCISIIAWATKSTRAASCCFAPSHVLITVRPVLVGPPLKNRNIFFWVDHAGVTPIFRLVGLFFCGIINNF